MPFRVSVLDLTVAVVVLVAIFLPDRGLHVVRAYEAESDTNHEIALYQSALAVEPHDGEAAARLSQLFIDVKQSDWAIQVAAAAVDDKRGDAWRALLAVSMAHAERVEVAQAHEFAERALSECRRSGREHCPVHEEARLAVYFDQLEAGAKSGIDPRVDPRGYEQAVFSKMRMIRFRGATPRDVPGPPSSPPSNPPEGQPSGQGNGDGAGASTGPANGSSPGSEQPATGSGTGAGN